VVVSGDAAVLTRQAISEAVGKSGWRFILGTVRTRVNVRSATQALEVVSRALAQAERSNAGCRVDVRPATVIVMLQSIDTGWVSQREMAAAQRISELLGEIGLTTHPGLTDDDPRSVQEIEIAIDATDIASVRPFWKAVMGYVAEMGLDGETDALVDPLRQSPAIWFQQMTEPRPQRNRIHLDVCVPHDIARARIDAALAAGGRLASDAEAPAFWVLADAEGNEVCITTWLGRDA
jgi:4a-hydroxytetrahydrobiopterin dehydratase